MLPADWRRDGVHFPPLALANKHFTIGPAYLTVLPGWERRWRGVYIGGICLGWRERGVMLHLNRPFVEFYDGEGMSTETDDTLELVHHALIIPLRSIGRIRRAQRDGRPIEPFLSDIEIGLEHIRSLTAPAVGTGGDER